MSKHVDYYVQARSEQEIVEAAQKWRREAERVLGGDYFNMVDFVKRVLQKGLRKRDPLEITFLSKSSTGPLAKVSFSPLKLSVNVSVWAAARDESDAMARYVLAHESAHIVLHDHEAKGFSGNTAERIPDSNREQSAEWQADLFADHFLAPLDIVSRYKHPEDIAMRCGVPVQVAARQLGRSTGYWQDNGSTYGEPCEHCYSSDTWILAGKVRCRSCGRPNSVIF